MKLLAPFGKLYGRIMDMRNVLYDRNVLKSYDLGARTISVGNLTTGGTGKTPLVALIASMLIDQGETVCILTRGYGRKDPNSRVLVSEGSHILVDAQTGGDEPVELAHKLDGKAVIVADANRVAAARWAKDRFGINVFVLDDGFQHRRARRVLDIVCVDATDPCGDGRLLPAGTLREPFRELKRADAIVITRVEQVSDTVGLESRLRKRNALAPIFKASMELKGLVSIDEFPAKMQRPQSESGESIFAFTAIANPQNFFESLSRNGLRVTGSKSFRDHHRFTQAEIDNTESEARRVGANALITTGKDAVKLTDLRFTLPGYVAVAKTVIDNSDEFRKLIISS